MLWTPSPEARPRGQKTGEVSFWRGLMSFSEVCSPGGKTYPAGGCEGLWMEQEGKQWTLY